MEGGIENDERILSLVLDLLREKVPLSDWPSDARAAVAGSLTRDGNAYEMSKTIRLRDHLFAGLAPHPDLTDGPQSCEADRLKADLADLTPYGAGCHLAIAT